MTNEKKNGKRANPLTAYNLKKKWKAARYTAKNLTARHGQIVIVGDSLIELMGNYPELMRGLKYEIYNRGIFGDNSDRMLARLNRNVLNAHPKGVGILIGTNDAAKMPEEETLRNIRTAVQRCAETGATVWVQSLYPIYPARLWDKTNGVRTNGWIVEMNEKIAALCTELGAIYIDMHARLVDERGEFRAEWTDDGIHPNEAGYRVIAEALRACYGALD